MEIKLSDLEKAKIISESSIKFDEHEDPDENNWNDILMEETELVIMEKIKSEIRIIQNTRC